MIETEHRGYRITYSENEDRWRCWDMDLEAATLSALKGSIDRLCASARKASGVPVLILSGEVSGFYGKKGVTEGRAVEVRCDARHRLRAAHEAAVMAIFDGERPSRRWVPVAALLRDTPENRELLDRYVAAEARREEENKRRAAENRLLLDAVEHVSEGEGDWGDLAELARLSEGVEG